MRIGSWVIDLLRTIYYKLFITKQIYKLPICSAASTLQLSIRFLRLGDTVTVMVTYSNLSHESVCVTLFLYDLLYIMFLVATNVKEIPLLSQH